MRFLFLLYISLLSTTTFANQVVDGKLFKPVYTTDQIKISVSEADDEQLLQAHYTVTLKGTSIETVKQRIFDVKDLAIWFDEISSATLVDKQSNAEQRAKLVISMPFPLTDRVVTMTQHLVEQDKSSLRIKLTANYKGLEQHDSYVRIPTFNGEWHAQQIGSDVKLDYRAIYNPLLASLPQALVVNNIKSSAKAYINNMASIDLNK
ncbi:MAG: hypothetical protein MI867_08275 [Pseudomonadales bacterium]|nr:hypothetical protein [Pseudomonadales bacterium]